MARHHGLDFSLAFVTDLFYQRGVVVFVQDRSHQRNGTQVYLSPAEAFQESRETLYRAGGLYTPAGRRG
jgi:hypothetical protein